MNIYIYNCQNTYNYGSMMMGENFITYYNAITDGKNKYYIETEDEANILRLKQATGVNEIYKVKINGLFKEEINKYDLIFGYLKLKKICSKMLHDIDSIVVLGGDDFTEDYGWKEPIFKAIKLNILKKNHKPVVLLGQTMGPYNSFRKVIMKSLLKTLDKIYPRDPITFQYLRDLKLRNIELTDDLALLILKKQEVIINSKEFITYCPSELIYKYSLDGNRDNWLTFNIFMIETLLNKYSDKKLVLLAHVLKPDHVDDRKITNQLYHLLEEKYKNRIILENNEILPYEVRNYIQRSYITISSRMHPIISSIQCEVPVIALSYSTKYWGIIGRRFGLDEYIIDVRQLNYNEMNDKFIELIDKIDKDYSQIQETMHNNNVNAKRTIEKSLLEIAKLK